MVGPPPVMTTFSSESAGSNDPRKIAYRLVGSGLETGPLHAMLLADRGARGLPGSATALTTLLRTSTATLPLTHSRWQVVGRDISEARHVLRSLIVEAGGDEADRTTDPYLGSDVVGWSR